MTKKYDPENGCRLTDCCGAYSTFMDDDLCCKACFNTVEFGEGDGSEHIRIQPARRVFVGYDDIRDYVDDSIDEPSDYNTPAIIEAVIARWPALIGYHDEVAKGAAIEAAIEEPELQSIIAANAL